MIDDKELKSILKKDKLTDIEIIEVLKRHILDTKGVTINSIERPTGEVCPKAMFSTSGLGIIIDVQLMNEMYNCSLKYYSEKFNYNFN
jgi:hypothetical protein